MRIRRPRRKPSFCEARVFCEELRASLVQYWPGQTCGEYYYTICIISVFSRYSLKRVCNYFGCRELVAVVEGADARKPPFERGMAMLPLIVKSATLTNGPCALCKCCIRDNWTIVPIRNDDFLVGLEARSWFTEHHMAELPLAIPFLLAEGCVRPSFCTPTCYYTLYS